MHSLDEAPGRHAIERSEVFIEQYLVATNEENGPFNAFRGNRKGGLGHDFVGLFLEILPIVRQGALQALLDID